MDPSGTACNRNNPRDGDTGPLVTDTLQTLGCRRTQSDRNATPGRYQALAEQLAKSNCVSAKAGQQHTLLH